MNNPIEVKVIQIENKQMSVWYSRKTLVSLMCMHANSVNMMGGFWTDFQTHKTRGTVSGANVPIDLITHTVDALYFKDGSDPWLYASITMIHTLHGKLSQSLIDRGLPIKGKLSAIGNCTSQREAVNINSFTIHIEHDITQKTYHTINAPIDSISG